MSARGFEQLSDGEARRGRNLVARGQPRPVVMSGEAYAACASCLVRHPVHPRVTGRRLRHTDSTRVERVYGPMSPTVHGDLIDDRQTVHGVYTTARGGDPFSDESDSLEPQNPANSLFRRRESNPYSRNQNLGYRLRDPRNRRETAIQDRR